MTTVKESDLLKNVKSIAKSLTTGEYDFDPDYSEFDEPCAEDYLTNVLDIEYYVSNRKKYLGARILVAFGGPNIWIDTRHLEVQGHWWGDNETVNFTDALGIHEYLAELYECL
jgi:hypothetical protein|tara:strand:- start:1327 stop:1665 length:339 start_codon:yes stop_codon:yes gene_type:complete